MPEQNPDRRRHSFGPIVLLGLASAALLAVATSKPLMEIPDSFWKSVGMGSFEGQIDELAGADAGELPLAAALSLVLLAAWGVLLVTRGVVRRAVAVLGLIAAVGALAAVILGWGGAADALRDDLADLLGMAGQTGKIPVERTGWWWAAVVAGVIATFAALGAVLQVPHWPEMGKRYDAPTAAKADQATTAKPAADPADAPEGDLWRAIDEGHDPTA